MDIKQNIGRRIRIVRASQKLTQEQMAKKLSVSPATVSAWEIGDIGISIEAAIRVSTFGDVSLDWLLNGKAETPDAVISWFESRYPSQQQRGFTDIVKPLFLSFIRGNSGKSYYYQAGGIKWAWQGC
jgi:transcriptional regulator with XRE-family HTH domain